MNQISGPFSIGKGLDNLLSGLGCIRMIRHIEVHQSASMMLQHDEHEQHFHGDGRHSEKSMDTV